MADKAIEKPQYFHRERIEKLLDEAFDKQVVFITAPMGYGKTTMVRKYLEKRKFDIVEWFYFGRVENDITWFWKQVDDLYQRNGYQKQASREFYLDNDRFEIMEFIESLEKTVGKETVCVFEDYHLSNRFVMNKVLEAISYANIPKLHCIIIGRFYPDMPYLEMKLKGSCEILDEQDFGLTKEETQAFFEGNNIQVNANQIEEIHQYTDGWMAAVYLVCMNCMQTGNISGNRSVTNLIRTSIFQKLTEEERDILEQLCWLPYCTAEQANFITGNDYAASSLFGMEKYIGFIHYLDDKGFSFHSMLQIVAKEEAMKHGRKEQDFLEKNAQWYMQQKEFINAIVAFAKLEKYETIFEILQTENMFTIYRESLITFYDIYQRVPLALKLKHINEYNFFISAYIINHDYYGGVALLKEIEPYMKDRPLPVEDDIVMCQIAMLENIKNFNRVKDMANASMPIMRKMSNQAREMYEREINKLLAVPNVLRVLHYKVGNMTGEIRYQQDEASTLGFQLEIQNDNLAYLAEYYYEIGKLEKAKNYAQKIYTRAVFQKNPVIFLATAYVLIHIDMFEGNRKGVRERLDELENIMTEYKQQLFQQDYDLLVASVYGSVHMVSPVKKWIRDIDLKHCNFVMKLSGTVHVVYAKILCGQKKYVALEIIAEEMLKNVQIETFVFKEIFGRMFLAIAKFQTGEETVAIRMMEQLLEMTQKDHVIMAYVENAIEVLPILEKVEKTEYVEEILQACESCIRAIERMGLKIDEEEKTEKQLLTEREQDVMKQVILGKKNAEIAQELHIAQITVEKTLSNIYRKLGVKNRAGALTEYQKLV